MSPSACSLVINLQKSLDISMRIGVVKFLIRKCRKSLVIIIKNILILMSQVVGNQQLMNIATCR